MTDDVLETRLREHFAGRAPGEPSPSLRDRLAAVPMGATPAPRRSWPRLAGAGAATVLAIAIGVVLARIALVDRSLAPVIVGTPSAPPATPLVLMPGDGVASPSIAPSFWLLVILIVAVIAIVIRVLRRHRLPRWAEWIAVAVVTIVVLSAFGRSTSGASLVDQGSWAPGLGWVEDTNGVTDGLTPDRGGMFLPGPNGSFSFALPVTNDGPLPVTIHGLAVAASDDASSANPRLVALGSPEPGKRWSGALVPGPAGVAPFVPVTLSAGETTLLSVLGVAGSCAATAGDTGVAGTSGFSSIPLVVDVAGFGYIEEVPITGVAIAEGDACSAP